MPVGTRKRAKVFLHTFRQPHLRDAWHAVLSAEQPDLVHIEHLMGMPFDMVSELVDSQIPYVITLHDYWYLCANAQLLTNTDQTICNGPDSQALNCARCALARANTRGVDRLAPAVASIMNRRNDRASTVLSRAARIIAPTKFVRDIYLSSGSNNLEIDVLEHGTALPSKLSINVQKARPDRFHGDRLHVGYIGSIAQQKGVHVLVEAVNSLPAQDVALTIYGELQTYPEYSSKLRSLAKHPGIKLAGPVERDQLWAALAEFDVFVFPTLWYEVSPLTIDEAFAVGIPIVASHIGAMSEKIIDGVNGRLFPPGDVGSLREILANLASSPEILSSWRCEIPPVFTIEDHIRALEEIYACALNTV